MVFFPCFESRKAAILILAPASGSLLSSLCSERQLWSLGRFLMERAGGGIPKCLAHASSYWSGELCRPMPCSNPGSASSRCFLSWRAAGHCGGGGVRGAGLRRDQPKEQSDDEISPARPAELRNFRAQLLLRPPKSLGLSRFHSSARSLRKGRARAPAGSSKQTPCRSREDCLEHSSPYPSALRPHTLHLCSSVEMHRKSPRHASSAQPRC